MPIVVVEEKKGKLKIKIIYIFFRFNYTLIFDEVELLVDFFAEFDRPSGESVDIAVKSRGVGVLPSLLLLLSFKLRRRTGFLSIRLEKPNDYLIK